MVIIKSKSRGDCPVEDGYNLFSTELQNFVVGIAGGGIGGLALALALKQKGIKFQIWERDDNFEARRQGYGLTLQQGGRAVKELGIAERVRERDGRLVLSAFCV